MIQRFIYGFILVGSAFCMVLLDAGLADRAGAGRVGELIQRGTFIPIMFAVLAVGGAIEMLRLLRAGGLRPHRSVVIGMTLLMILTPWLSATRLLGDAAADQEGFRWQLVWVGLLALLTAAAQMRRPVNQAALADMATTFLVPICVGLLPSFALQLRCSRDIPGSDGAWWMVVFLSVTKASDIGGYIFGTLFGRHKLIPKISPGKSVEGMIGGILASALMALGFFSIHNILSHFISAGSGWIVGMERMTAGVRSLEVWQVLLFGVLMSIFGLLGDLFESLFKRAAGKKDSASIIPGFGGVLDLIDSPIMAAPVAWFVLTVWWNVV